VRWSILPWPTKRSGGGWIDLFLLDPVVSRIKNAIFLDTGKVGPEDRLPFAVDPALPALKLQRSQEDRAPSGT